MTLECSVWSVGVWHSAQPTLTNRLPPLAIDVVPPGVSEEGVGAARKRWKKANLSIALLASSGVVASALVMLLGTPVNWHDAASLRSVWNSSLVIPISTL